MAEINQKILEGSNPKPELPSDSEGSSFSSFTISFIQSKVTDTLAGGDGNDTLNGGDSNDLIDGKNGNDLLDGKEGNDAIAGGRGDDTLIGGSGDDSLYGELVDFLGISSFPVTEGQNYLDGGDGDDILSAGGKNDTLMGGNGDDYLYGGGAVSGNDVLNGGHGNDTLYGAQGADTLIGESGHDLLTGYSGHDLLTGGHGDDTLQGGPDSDTLTGGEGADIFSFDLLFPRALLFISKIIGSQSTIGSQFTGPPKPELGIDTIQDFNAEEGDKIQISGFRRADSSEEVSLSQFHYNQSTGILSFENKEFAQLQAGADLIVDRDVILSISSF